MHTGQRQRYSYNTANIRIRAFRTEIGIMLKVLCKGNVKCSAQWRVEWRARKLPQSFEYPNNNKVL
jgi:hypothetical protein